MGGQVLLALNSGAQRRPTDTKTALSLANESARDCAVKWTALSGRRA
jgi:hypothetical protein